MIYGFLSNREAAMSAVEHLLTEVERVIDDLPETTDKAPPLTFAISMRSAKASKNWQGAVDRLSSTLNTLLGQSDPNFQIIIAGHEKPNIPQLDSEKVIWITSPNDPPTDISRYSGDKMFKRRLIGVYLGKQEYEGYFMALDADDWVHRRFVEYIRRLPYSPATFLDAGFIANWNQRKVWGRSSKLGGRPFFKGCGSSSIFHFRGSDFPKSESKWAIVDSKFSIATTDHCSIYDALNMAGVETRVSGISLVTWVLGHENNNSLAKGKKSIDISNSRAESMGIEFFESFSIREKEDVYSH